MSGFDDFFYFLSKSCLLVKFYCLRSPCSQSKVHKKKTFFHQCENNRYYKTRTSLEAHSWRNISLKVVVITVFIAVSQTVLWLSEWMYLHWGGSVTHTPTYTHTLRYQTAKEKINTRFPPHTLSLTSRVRTHSQLAGKFVRLCLQMWFHLIARLSEAQWDITIITWRDPPSFSPRVISLSKQPLLSWLVTHTHTHTYTHTGTYWADNSWYWPLIARWSFTPLLSLEGKRKTTERAAEGSITGNKWRDEEKRDG